jgi:hypothetical protein
MLRKPKNESASRFPAVLIVLALVAGSSYLLFFRAKPAETPVAAAPKAPDAAAFEKAFRESAPPAAAPVAAPAPAPKPEVRKPAPAPEAVAPVKFEPAAPPAPRTEIQALVASGKVREARSRLAALFSGAISDETRTELAEIGIQINRELLQNREDEKEFELYEIRQGDTLEAIARRYKTLNGVKGSIMYVNNYKEDAILRAGRKVRIAKGVWSALVDKSLFRMWILYEGCPFKGYAVTIGAAEKETPVTRFLVGSKNPKPAWWPPADTGVKGPVPYGDPKNPLGEWWVSLEHDLYHGFGIHGTNAPETIGSKASNGCVRMLNPEVGQVAALAYKGMVVQVVD